MIDWRGCSFLSIDPGINKTGIAAYYIQNDGKLHIRYADIISTRPDQDDLERAGVIAEQVHAHVCTRKPAFVFLERPPNTIYHQGKSSANLLIARAQNVFKLVGVAYSIAFALRKCMGVRVVPVEPVKWQERSKAKRGDLEIKCWSIKLANSLLMQISQLPPTLHTERDENIADAICLGYIAYTKKLMN